MYPKYLIVLFCLLITSLVKAQEPSTASLSNSQNVSIPASTSDSIYTEVDSTAVFPGGRRAWFNYLAHNLNAQVPAENRAKSGTYTVFIRFVIGKYGTACNFEPLTNLGYGMEQEVIRILQSSPKWIPAIKDGKAVSSYKKQPVSFSVDNGDRGN